MKLAEYLERERLTATAFAKRLGVSHATVVRYLSGARRPNWDVLRRIEKSTKGAVTSRDFMETDSEREGAKRRGGGAKSETASARASRKGSAPRGASAAPAQVGSKAASGPKAASGLKARKGLRVWIVGLFAALVVSATLYGVWPIIAERGFPPLHLGVSEPAPFEAPPSDALPPETLPSRSALAEAPAAPEEAMAAPEEARPETPDDSIAALNARVAELEEALANANARLEEASAPGAAPAVAVPAAALPEEAPDEASALADLERRLTEMEARLPEASEGPGPSAGPGPLEGTGSAPLAQDLELAELAGLAQRLAQRLDRIERELEARGAEDARRIELVLAAAQVRAALVRGAPFDGELALLRAAAESDPALLAVADGLSAFAPDGVLTGEALRLRFGETANAIVSAALAPEGSSWLDQTLQKLSEIVTVRRVGGHVEGDEPEALAARAEARLAEGNLAAAVAELEGLSGAPAEAAEAWLAEARRRLAAEARLGALERHLASRLKMPQA